MRKSKSTYRTSYISSRSLNKPLLFENAIFNHQKCNQNIRISKQLVDLMNDNKNSPRKAKLTFKSPLIEIQQPTPRNRQLFGEKRSFLTLPSVRSTSHRYQTQISENESVYLRKFQEINIVNIHTATARQKLQLY